MSKFSQFPLLPSLQATLKEKDLHTPTNIQEKAIPALLAGCSLVGVAETGSGKTFAFALPILHILKTLENEGSKITEESQPRALVIVPTRELGDQVTKAFKPFTHGTRLRVRSVLGGTDMDVAKRNIAGAFDVLVATPGRITRLLQRNLISFSDVRVLVFDEADQMLDQGFRSDVDLIFEACPAERQNVLFSATISPKVEELIKSLFADAEVIRSEGSHRLVPTLATQNIQVVNGKRFPLLHSLLAKPVEGGTMIFTNTREQCDKLVTELKQNGHECVVYRGEMDKSERRVNLKAFKENKINLLVATDLASRGLDLAQVGRVINYHLPQEMENYIHRAGRTARAGRQGLVVNFVTERDANLISKLDSIQAKKTRS